MTDRKRLADILINSDRERLERTWSTVKAAEDLTPIPAGEYLVEITVKGASGEAKELVPLRVGS